MGMFSSPLVSMKQLTYGKKKAKNYDRISKEARTEQEGISKQLNEWGQKDWDHWLNKLAPAEDATVARAKEGFVAQTDRVTGNAATDNAIAMRGAKASSDATLNRRGLNPASGAAIAARARLSNAGGAKTGADINMARTNEENRVNDMNWNNRLNLVGMGSRGLADQALMLTKASDVVSTGMRRAAGLSDMYSNAATAGLSGVGEGIGQAAGAYGKYSKGNTEKAGGNWDWNKTDQYGNTYGNNTDDDYHDNQNKAFNSGDTGTSWGGYADGGLVVGPGTGTSDSIPANIDGETPAAVSNGEYRIPAAVVAKIGRQKLEAIVAKYHTPVASQRGA